MAEIKFIVRRKFQYGERWYMPGEEFEPQGGRFDDGILRSNLVYQDTGKFRHPSRVSFRRERGHSRRIGTKAMQRLQEQEQRKAVKKSKTAVPVKEKVVYPSPVEEKEI